MIDSFVRASRFSVITSLFLRRIFFEAYYSVLFSYRLLLGAAQKAALTAWLLATRDVPLKFIASPVPFSTLEGPGGDGWARFPTEVCMSLSLVSWTSFYSLSLGFCSNLIMGLRYFLSWDSALLLSLRLRSILILELRSDVSAHGCSTFLPRTTSVGWCF